MNLEPLQKLKAEKVGDYIYRVLKHNILKLTLMPGTMLNEAELSELLGVSRTPVREAILRLKEERLMETFPQSGSQVALIDPEYFDAISFVRVALESHALEQLCRECPPEIDILLSESLEYQNAVCHMDVPDFWLFVRMDGQFHEIFISSAGNSELTRLYKKYTEYFLRVSNLLLTYRVNEARSSYEDHRKILQLIRRQDAAGAQNLIRDHLRRYAPLNKHKELLQYFK